MTGHGFGLLLLPLHKINCCEQLCLRVRTCGDTRCDDSPLLTFVIGTLEHRGTLSTVTPRYDTSSQTVSDLFVKTLHQLRLFRFLFLVVVPSNLVRTISDAQVCHKLFTSCQKKRLTHFHVFLQF